MSEPSITKVRRDLDRLGAGRKAALRDLARHRLEQAMPSLPWIPLVDVDREAWRILRDSRDQTKVGSPHDRP